jgi:hypothetical protein
MKLNRFSHYLTTKTISNHYKLDDDFVKRLRSLVIGEGMLSDNNIKLINYAIQHLPKEGHVVEIGSYGGLSINLIIHLLKKYNKNNLVFNCDPWIYEGFHDHKGQVSEIIDGRNDISRIAYSAYMQTAYKHATAFLSFDRLPHTYPLASDDFFERWRKMNAMDDIFGSHQTLGGPIAFAYIDGYHSFEQSKKDFENVAEYLVPNGFILFDDSAQYYSYGSAQLMNTIKKDKRFKVLENRHNWLVERV